MADPEEFLTAAELRAIDDDPVLTPADVAAYRDETAEPEEVTA